jgi:hypothetical protein
LQSARWQFARFRCAARLVPMCASMSFTALVMEEFANESWSCKKSGAWPVYTVHTKQERAEQTGHMMLAFANRLVTNL